MIRSCCFSGRLIAFLLWFWTPLFAAGVFQVGRIKWCVWGAEIVLCERGRYLVRAAALCGDLINRNSPRLLSRPCSAHLGGQIYFLLPSVFTAEVSGKTCCIFVHSFLSVHYFDLVQNSLLFFTVHVNVADGEDLTGTFRCANLTNKSLLALVSNRRESLIKIWIFRRLRVIQNAQSDLQDGL